MTLGHDGIILAQPVRICIPRFHNINQCVNRRTLGPVGTDNSLLFSSLGSSFFYSLMNIDYITPKPSNLIYAFLAPSYLEQRTGSNSLIASIFFLCRMNESVAQKVS